VLIELRIQDLAVVASAALEFGPGLNVLTGETGAGKSMIVDALAVALGARVTSDLIRTGAGSASVEARFDIDADGPAGRWLREAGLDADELIVSREIAAEGRSRAWINGRPATVGMLRELGDLIVEVAGQHEGQRLLRPSVHIELLDAFGGSPLAALRAEVAEGVHTRAVLLGELRVLAEGERERARQIDVLRYQVQEIDAARLQADDEGDLQARHARLTNADRLSTAALAAYAALYEADGQAATDRVGQAKSALRDAAVLDPALSGAFQRIDGLAAELADVAHGLAQYAETLEARPDELAAVEDRLELIRSLKRKYGASVEGILAYRQQASETLTRLEASDARSPEIAAALADLDRALAERCGRLTHMRREAAARLESEVERTLRVLEMGRTRITVSFAVDPDEGGLVIEQTRVAVGPTGVDRVELLLAPNPGEAPRPLARIASGGELSRVMLALRHALAEAGGVPVLICDEVDAGVGSRTAGAVGQLLATVARTRQVLCVTHLPQIASLADRHFWVTKETHGGRTRVRVRPLAADERVEEIARMLGGRQPTPIAREHAEELLRTTRRQSAGKSARGGKS
jgi:DNA repair protein RecN (Recombination protein N)